MQKIKNLLSDGFSFPTIFKSGINFFLFPLIPLLQKLRLYVYLLECVILTFVAKLWFFLFDTTNIVEKDIFSNKYRVQKKITKHQKIARLIYVFTVRVLNYFGLSIFASESSPQKINYFLEGRRTLIHSICLKKIQRQVEKTGEKAIWIDFGSGDASLLDFLSNQEIEKNFSKIIFVEPCTELNEIAEKRIKSRKINKEKTILQFINKTAKQFIENNSNSNSNLKNNVDMVTFCYSLSMMDAWFDNLESSKKMLKKNGKGFIAVLDFHVSKKYAMPEDLYYYQRPPSPKKLVSETIPDQSSIIEKQQQQETTENENKTSSEHEETSSDQESKPKKQQIQTLNSKKPIILESHGSFTRHCIPFIASLVSDGIVSISDDHLPFLISKFDTIWMKQGEWNLGPLGIFPINWIIPTFLSMKISFLFSVPIFMYIGQTKTKSQQQQNQEQPIKEEAVVPEKETEEEEEQEQEEEEQEEMKAEPEEEEKKGTSFSQEEMASMMSQLRKEVEQLKQVVGDKSSKSEIIQ